MRKFFNHLRKLSQDELTSLAGLCAGASFLLLVALMLSGGATFLPQSLRVALERVHLVAAAQAAAVPYWQTPYPAAGDGYLSPGTYIYFDNYAPTCGYNGNYPLLNSLVGIGALSVSQGSRGAASYILANSTTGGTGGFVMLPGSSMQIDYSCRPTYGEAHEHEECHYQFPSGTHCGCYGGPGYSYTSSNQATLSGPGVSVTNTSSLAGSLTVAPPGNAGDTLTYTLTCSGASTWVTTIPVRLTTATLSLDADKTTVPSGGTSTLSWRTTNITPSSCTISGPNGIIGAKGLGSDTSGTANIWTLNNIDAGDQTIDTPTNNFAALNQIYTYPYKATVQEAGLAVNAGGVWASSPGWQLTSGKWYWEVTPLTGADVNTINGVQKDANSGFGGHAYAGHDHDTGYGWFGDGRVLSDVYSTTPRPQGLLPSYAAGDTIGIAYDADSGKVYFSKNGTWLSGDNLIPTMTAATNGSVVMSGSTEYQPAWYAGDKTPGNYWDSYSNIPSVSVPQWLQTDFGSGNAKTVNSYSVRIYAGALNYQPADWTLQGSNNGSSWSVLDTRSSIVWSVAGQTKIFTVATPGSYRYYRLSVTRTGDGARVIIAELGLYPEASPSPADGTSYIGIVQGGWPSVANYSYKSLVNFGQWQPATKLGAGAAYFNGTNAYLTTPTTADLVPQGDYTVDLWAMPTTVGGAHGLIGSDTANSYAPFVIYQSGGSILFYSSNTSNSWNIGTGQPICSSVNVNTWYHLAVVRLGSVYYLYCNGTLTSTFTNAAALSWTPANPLVIGRQAQSGPYFQGYLDEVRISNKARWVVNFTPPTAPYSTDGNTALLLHMDGPTLPDSSSNAHPMTLNGDLHYSAASAYAAGSGGEFAYQPPSGFKALSTANLPAPAVNQPSQYFNAVTYTGNGGNQTIGNLGVTPDLVWIKSRAATYWNTLTDSVRGPNSDLFSNDRSAQTQNDPNGWVNAIGANSFGVGGQCLVAPPNTNLIGSSYISWAWKKSPTAGIDVVAYTGDGAPQRAVSHSLGTTPDTIIIKRTDQPSDWFVWNSGLGSAGAFLKLNTTDAPTITNSPFTNDLVPTMTGPTTNGVTMSASTIYSSGYPAWYAGDKNTANYWNSTTFTYLSTTSPQWLQVDFGANNAQTVGAYTITPYTGNIVYAPTSFTLYGSNDANSCTSSGALFTVLDFETPSWITAQPQTFYIPAANQGSYRCYRINVIANGGANQVLMSELNLWPARGVPTASNFAVTNNTTNSANTLGASYVAYLFSNREGFQKSGMYVGNGSTDGPFVYTGFKPKFVMIKDASVSNSYTHWTVYDSTRDPLGNPVIDTIYPDGSLVENGDGYCAGTNCPVDFSSNGFKVRSAGYWNTNNNQNNYVYMAFADVPFKASATANGYSIPNSLRFDSSTSNMSLSYRPASSGNSTTWTFSTWVKRGQLAALKPIFGGYNGSNSDAGALMIYFNTSDQLGVTGNNTNWKISSQVFRDPSAWYHVVVAVDTTQANANNRIRAYVNGQEVTSWVTSNPPTQNYAFPIDTSTASMYLGYMPDWGVYADEFLADTYMVDGQQLAASNFGAADSSGFWKPKAYAGTYGTDGFYLNYQNSLSLGTDSSGLGHTFTVAGVSATDQVVDAPTNNFATLNQTYTYTSKANIQAGGLAVNGGNSWAATPGWQLSSGKWYWEVTPVTWADGNTINGVEKDSNSGFGNHVYAGHNNDAGFGYAANGVVYNSGNVIPSTVSAYTMGDVIGFAYDANTGNLYASRNGVWQNGNSLIPQMTGPTTGGVTMDASTYWTTGYEPWRAADWTNNTKWYTYSHVPSPGSPDWLRVNFGAGNTQTVASYSLKANDSIGYEPINFNLQGSNDVNTCTSSGINWVTLDTETNVAWTIASQVRYFTVPAGNRTSYQCYRLLVGGAGTTAAPTYYLALTEFGLYSSATPNPLDGSVLPIGTIAGGWPSIANYSYKSAVSFGQGGGQTTTFADSSSYNRTMAIAGTVQPSAAAYKFGPSSAYFNSSVVNSWLTTPQTPELNMAGDYTIDLWAYPTALPAGVGLLNRDSNTRYSPYGIYQNGSQFLFYGSYTGGGWDVAAQPICNGVQANFKWYHLAVVRTGNTFKTFCDGNQVSSGTMTASWASPWPLVLGRWYQGGGYYQGYLDEVRISNVARWTSSFTPPTSAYSSDANTVVLLHMSDDKSLFYGAGSGGYFAYQPPSGYKALSTNNLSAPAAAKPNQYFDAKAYTGTGGVQSLDPVNKGQYMALSNSNFDATSQTNSWTSDYVYSTGSFSSGKWYAEYKMTSQYPVSVGIADAAKQTSTSNVLGSLANEYAYYPWGSCTYMSGVCTATSNTTAVGDVYMVAVDMDAGKIWFGRNGTWLGGGNPSAGTSPQYSTGITGTTKVFAMSAYAGAGTILANFGQAGRAGSAYYSSAGGYFYYAPPTGFNALAAGGGSQTIPLNFQPDLVWIKNRITTNWNTIVDSGRGATFDLFSNDQSAQTQNDINGTVTAFNTNGFTVGGSCAAGSGASGNVNAQNTPYVAWVWSRSSLAGVDIVAYSGNGAATQSVAHNLGTSPDFILAKRTDQPGDWFAWSSALGGGSFLKLNTTDAKTNTLSPFAADLIPTMTGVTTAGVTMSGSIEYQPAWYAGDKNVGSYWQAYNGVVGYPNSGTPQWLKVDFGSSPKTVGAYTITTYSSNGYYNPTDFTFDGSNDNSTWTPLDTEVGASWVGYPSTRTFVVPAANRTSYRYYRVRITKTSSGLDGIISELNLWSTPVASTATFTVGNQNGGSGLNNIATSTDAIPTMTGATTGSVSVSASSVWSGSYPAYQAGDKNINTYWNSTSVTSGAGGVISPTQWLQADLGSGKTIAAYAVTKYNSTNQTYDPISWTLVGSTDGVNWSAPLDTETNIAWNTAAEAKTFFVPSASQASYRYYRLNITANGGGNQVLVAELNLYPAAAGNAQYVAYVFSNREGFQKSGVYIANNSADGPFVYTGFKPKFVMIKDISRNDANTKWNTYDTTRDPSGNPATHMLFPNAALAENNDGSCNGANCPIDFLANGFKIRTGSYTNVNYSTDSYAYVAFADTPFKLAYAPGAATIGNSLKFDAASGAYLSKTFTAAGNQTTWTFSAWVKRGQLGSLMKIFEAGPAGSGEDGVAFMPNDGIEVYQYNGGYQFQLDTTQVFRDPSAWIHIVVAIDTTQPVPSDRVKLYINGSQVTSFSTANYPTQNFLTTINSVIQHNIGTLPSQGAYFDGQLSDVYFVDGQQLAPSAFGAADTYGYWHPAAYIGAYGTNGFHLTFNSVGVTDFSSGSSDPNNPLIVGPLYKTSTYTLMCLAPESTTATISASRTITVGDAALLLIACNAAGTSCSSGSTPAYLNPGDRAYFTWSAPGADANSCNVSSSSGGSILPANTNTVPSTTPSVSLPVYTDTTYTLACTVGGAATSVTAKVSAGQPCATGVGTASNSCSSQCVFDTNSATVQPGGTAILSWCCPGGGTSAGVNFSTGGAPSGTATVGVGNYQLSCPSGSGSQSIVIGAPLPTLVTFSVLPVRARRGVATPVTFTWKVLTPPSSCTITGPSGFTPLTISPTDNVTSSVSSTATINSPSVFTLTCGSVSMTATISLVPMFIEI